MNVFVRNVCKLLPAFAAVGFMLVMESATVRILLSAGAHDHATNNIGGHLLLLLTVGRFRALLPTGPFRIEGHNAAYRFENEMCNKIVISVVAAALVSFYHSAYISFYWFAFSAVRSLL